MIPPLPERAAEGTECHRSQPCFPSLLPPELLGKVFGCLDDAARCRVIPLVCRSWLQIHKQYPPIRITWSIRADKCVTKPMVEHFLRSSSHVETLEVWSYGRSPSFIPQLLSAAAFSAPHLRHLSLQQAPLCFQPVMHSLAFLSQLRTLELWSITFPVDQANRVCMGNLSCLILLKDLHLQEIDLTNSTPEDGDALWAALSSLPGLKKLSFYNAFEKDDGRDADRPLFFSSVSLLTNISDLDIGLTPDCLEDTAGTWMMPAVFSKLTQLTSVELNTFEDYECLPLTALPHLESLCLPENGADLPDEWQCPVSIASTRLTYLQIICRNLPLEAHLVPEPPALPFLHTLVATGSQHSDMGLKIFPLSFALKLNRLVKLDLSKNKFQELPPPIAHMSALQELDLSHNADLQLQASDIVTLSSLCNLRLLSLQQSSRLQDRHSWTPGSLKVFSSITTMFPELVVKT